jgi:hypothetical protein
MTFTLLFAAMWLTAFLLVFIFLSGTPRLWGPDDET